MIAMLGMYDMPATQASNDRFWQAIRYRLGFGPANLTRAADVWNIWQSPDLLLAQTCGMPYRTRLHEKVNLVGTPDYDLPGCPPGYYNSVLVVRADAAGDSPHDFAGGTFAYNEALSQSGWAAPKSHFGDLGIEFSAHLATGGHAKSAHAVAEGRADMAALDALTWALLNEHDPVVAQLRVIGTTQPTPTLPYITAATHDPAPLAKAIAGAITDLDNETSATLHLKGLTQISKDAYLAVPNPPGP